ncbi:hypothetical protein TNIN_411471 [Trichonephila inaurata madagascariensis]|uniref:Uncharacterized protein n=1 Tax=Trichonephila inaurata madagascariensis TaxID=2747483 RepID=A0A8X7BT40_9ARAC|nr:hypothetical protein TNIN_411471 [Trichonephila inaurata madagascariensis]
MRSQLGRNRQRKEEQSHQVCVLFFLETMYTDERSYITKLYLNHYYGMRTTLISYSFPEMAPGKCEKE